MVSGIPEGGFFIMADTRYGMVWYLIYNTLRVDFSDLLVSDCPFLARTSIFLLPSCCVHATILTHDQQHECERGVSEPTHSRLPRDDTRLGLLQVWYGIVWYSMVCCYFHLLFYFEWLFEIRAGPQFSPIHVHILHSLLNAYPDS